MIKNKHPTAVDKENKSRMLNLTAIDDTVKSTSSASAAKSVTKFELKTDNQKDVQYAIKKIYAEQKEQNKENVGTNRSEPGRKMVSHYKNSKIMSIKPIEKKLSLTSFRVGRKLGRGRFGSVHMA